MQVALRFGATEMINTSVDDPVAAVHEICAGPADFRLECTGVVAVRPAGAQVEFDHLSTLWGKRIVGVLGGEGRSAPLVTTLLDLHRQGRFPFDELVTHFPFERITEAIKAAEEGEVVKPVLRMP